MHPAVTAPADPKKTLSKRPAFWVGIGALILLCCVAMWGQIMGWERPAEAGDKELLLTLDELGLDDSVAVEPATERLWRTRYIDFSLQVDYEFESEALYMSSTINREMNERDARNVYTGYQAAIPLGSLVTGAGMEESVRDDLFEWGDQSRLSILEIEGDPVGNYFIARKGKRVFSLMLSGVYYDSAEGLEEVLTPALERMMKADL